MRIATVENSREDEVSSEGRRLRPEGLRLPDTLLLAVRELRDGAERKRKTIEETEDIEYLDGCYRRCLSAAKLAIRALLEGEPGQPRAAGPLAV